ncbi:hypothetical protein [Candidatus Parabeggiatoa sp. HSG14]|uniref:hypothetical protein n=1 Tax=Candidatus Parabeggiatoa sp. HSG14 TaxID=3055593 RepID=UPI0025A8248F|nr:hypothetical protein [Thiotrichales bacterium HSG14]
MKPFLTQFILVILLYGISPHSFGYPVMHLNNNDEVQFDTPTDNATRILKDSTDNNVYYIPPKRVILAEEPLTQRKLFRLTYSSVRKDAELFAVFKLGFDIKKVTAEWKRIVASNPNASLKTLPIYGGVFGLEFDTGEFKIVLGKADVVETDIAAGVIPVHIKIHKTGLKFLRAFSKIPGTKLLTLNFDYKTKYLLPGQDFLFNVNPHKLLTHFLADKHIKAAWEKSELLAKGEIKKYLFRVFAPPQQLWFVTNNMDQENIDLNLSSYLFYHAFLDYLQGIAGNDFEMISQKKIRNLSLTQIVDETITLKGIAPNEPIEVSESAAMVLSGVCEHYADAVFIEETGESNCLEFPLKKMEDNIQKRIEEEEAWVPIF